MKNKTEGDILAEHIETCHKPSDYWVGKFKDEIPDIPSYSGGSGGNTSGGSAVLESDITANVTAGAITPGTTLAKGTTLTEAFRKLLVKYIEPSASIKSSNTITEKWNPLTGTTLTFGATGGTAGISSVAVYRGSTLIYSTTGSGSYTDTTAIETTTTYKIIATDKNGHTATASTTVNVVLPYYYGVSASSAVEDVSVFTQKTAVKGSQEITYAPEVEYIYFAFDSTYTLADIKDAQGDSCKASFNDPKTVSITKNGKTYSYKMYVSKLVAKSTSYKLTFSFS